MGEAAGLQAQKGGRDGQKHASHQLLLTPGAGFLAGRRGGEGLADDIPAWVAERIATGAIIERQHGVGNGGAGMGQGDARTGRQVGAGENGDEVLCAVPPVGDGKRTQAAGERGGWTGGVDTVVGGDQAILFRHAGDGSDGLMNKLEIRGGVLERKMIGGTVPVPQNAPSLFWVVRV